MSQVVVKGATIDHGAAITDATQSLITIDGIPIAVNGAAVATHTDSEQNVHKDPVINSPQQSFVTIDGKEIIINGDGASCGGSVNNPAQSLVKIS